MSKQRPILIAALLAILGASPRASADSRTLGSADPAVGMLDDADGNQVVQTAYSDLFSAGPPLSPPPSVGPTMALPPTNQPVYYPPTHPPAQQPTTVAPAPGQVIYADPSWDCDEPVLCRPSGWYSSFEVIDTQAHLTRGEFGSWPDDSAVAGRVILGCEDPNGVGVRGRFWIFDQQDVDAFSETAGLAAWTFQLDTYKRWYFDEGDVMLGAGPAFGGLSLTGPQGRSRFDGVGLTVFAEGYYPLIRRDRHELGMAARGRVSLMTGNWNDSSSGNIVLETDGDSMSVTELQWGPEYRWTFGRNLDHQLLLTSYIEHQRWQSDWMGAFSLSSVSFTGVSLNAGIRW